MGSSSPRPALQASCATQPPGEVGVGSRVGRTAGGLWFGWRPPGLSLKSVHGVSRKGLQPEGHCAISPPGRRLWGWLFPGGIHSLLALGRPQQMA